MRWQLYSTLMTGWYCRMMYHCHPCVLFITFNVAAHFFLRRYSLFPYFSLYLFRACPSKMENCFVRTLFKDVSGGKFFNTAVTKCATRLDVGCKSLSSFKFKFRRQSSLLVINGTISSNRIYWGSSARCQTCISSCVHRGHCSSKTDSQIDCNNHQCPTS